MARLVKLDDCCMAVLLVAIAGALTPNCALGDRGLIVVLLAFPDNAEVRTLSPDITIDQKNMAGAKDPQGRWVWPLAATDRALYSDVNVQRLEAITGHTFRGMQLRVPYFVGRPLAVYINLVKEAPLENPAALGRWAYDQDLSILSTQAVFQFYERMREPTAARVKQLIEDPGQQVFGPNDAKLLFKFLEATDILFTKAYVQAPADVWTVADYLAARLANVDDARFVDRGVGKKNATDILRNIREQKTIYFQKLFDEISRETSPDKKCLRFERLQAELNDIPVGEAPQSLDNLAGRTVAAVAQCTGTKALNSSIAVGEATDAIARQLDQITTTLEARKLTPAVRSEVRSRGVELKAMAR